MSTKSQRIKFTLVCQQPVKGEPCGRKHTEKLYQDHTGTKFSQCPVHGSALHKIIPLGSESRKAAGPSMFGGMLNQRIGK